MPAIENAVGAERSARIQMIARAVFYVLTLMAAVLAISASIVGGRSGAVLMSVSWYFIAAGMAAFLVMLLLNMLLREDDPPSELPSLLDERRD